MLIGGLHSVFLYIAICGMQARRKDYNHTTLLRIFKSIMFLVCFLLSQTPLCFFRPLHIFCPNKDHSGHNYWYRKFLRTLITIFCHNNSCCHFPPPCLFAIAIKWMLSRNILHKSLKKFCTHPEPWPICDHTYTKLRLLQCLNSFHETSVKVSPLAHTGLPQAVLCQERTYFCKFETGCFLQADKTLEEEGEWAGLWHPLTPKPNPQDKFFISLFWPPDVKNWLIEKDPNAGKDWRQEEKGNLLTTRGEMVRWHHQLDGREFEQIPGVGDRQGSLECCSPRVRRDSDTTEWLNWVLGPDMFQNLDIRNVIRCIFLYMGHC